jgi:hypothetical protein
MAISEEDRLAGLRWTEINYLNKEAGCKCGRPAAEVRYDDRNAGPVSVEMWTCADHVGVVSWQLKGEEWIPFWARPDQCSDCFGNCPTIRYINETRPYKWFCSFGPPAPEGFVDGQA